MPKFSIIVPVYNVEDYIEKCLESIKNQTYKDYEVIIVNDGSKDKSIEKAKKYPYKIINQKNMGLSAARNTGIKHATGDYLIFLDSDDYIEKDLLRQINNSLKNDPDIVRFQIREVYEDGKKIDYKEEKFTNKKGEEAFELITKYHFVENAWCYAIKKEYWFNNKFQFKKGTVHEDYGIIPLVIIKSKTVNSISYIGYNYVQRNGSIMNSSNYEKTKKKVNDFYEHYKYLNKEIDKTNINSKIFKSFIANSMLLKICNLKYKDYKKHLKNLKKLNIYDNILSDTATRKIKKILLKISPRLYYKIKG